MESSYKQKIGSAMGSECSPEICDITLIKCEKETILPKNPLTVKCMRYRDEVLISFNCNENQVRELVCNINNLLPTLKIIAKFKLSLTSSSTKEKRFQKEEKLDIGVATKKTDTFQCLARDSTYLKSVFHGLIKRN